MELKKLTLFVKKNYQSLQIKRSTSNCQSYICESCYFIFVFLAFLPNDQVEVKPRFGRLLKFVDFPLLELKSSNLEPCGFGFVKLPNYVDDLCSGLYLLYVMIVFISNPDLRNIAYLCVWFRYQSLPLISKFSFLQILRLEDTEAI